MLPCCCCCGVPGACSLPPLHAVTAAGGGIIAASAATGTLRGWPLGASTLATPVPGLVPLLRLPMPLLPPIGDLQLVSAKSLLWLMMPAGCALGLLAAATLSVCSVARRLAMLPLSRALRVASLELLWWLALPAGRSLLCWALLRVVLRYALRPAAAAAELLPAAPALAGA